MAKKNEPIPIDCIEAVNRFNDFLDHYLKGKERKELMHHVSTCRSCFDRLEFEQLLKSKIASFGNSGSEDKTAAKKQLEKILSKLNV